MSKKNKILIITILSVALVIVIAVAAFLYIQKESMQGTCGDGLTWSYNGKGTLTISGCGEMENYTSHSKRPGWDDFKEEITTVIVQEGVKSIGNWAFYDQHNYPIEHVDLPDTLTKIGESAFSDCTELTQIVIPKNVTEIGSGAFSHCRRLCKINIPHGVSVVNPLTFLGCKSLTDISLDSVTSIGHQAFQNCTSLVRVEFSNNLTTIGFSSFSDCNSLKAITIPQSVSSIANRAFSYCTSLATITFLGDMPFELSHDENGNPVYLATFIDVTATAYYPANNTTWTSSDFSRYLHDEGIRWVTQ